MSSRDEAFAEFYSAAHAQLCRTAYLLCGDPHRAADLAQDGLIKVYVAWPRLTRQGGEFAYARKAVVSAFLDSHRKRSNHERPGDTSGSAEAEADHADAVADRATVLGALIELPQQQRACVVLRYYDDLSVRDTAAALGCTEGTVKSHTSRALEHLRNTLGEHADNLTALIERSHR
ncbi:SigE family RNA polymerase sigma factor [Nocardioides speluncae]|uniref:SigE family RNA polymerase sigma factor n=1 Tax=Nocardioides speluncae TaxID=2670337 RepID=UPI000D68575E|nr:SigE family RNA polymerase sigma factor [Nocardioides speluncae]